MEKTSFRFNDEQRETLLACWKRPRGREIAAKYLIEVELSVARWMQEQRQNPPTGVKEQIDRSSDLCNKARELLVLLEGLPHDMAGLLNVFWLHKQYGETYFRMHEEAHRKDRENNTALRIVLTKAFQNLAYDKMPEASTIVSEVSKLPPDFFQQSKAVIDFLSVVESASLEMAARIRAQKNWHNKAAEEGLLYSLALLYQDHFGKLPAAGNAGKEGFASPFRSFLIELSNILGCKLGADITRDVLRALKENRQLP